MVSRAACGSHTPLARARSSWPRGVGGAPAPKNHSWGTNTPHLAPSVSCPGCLPRATSLYPRWAARGHRWWRFPALSEQAPLERGCDFGASRRLCAGVLGAQGVVLGSVGVSSLQSCKRDTIIWKLFSKKCCASSPVLICARLGWLRAEVGFYPPTAVQDPRCRVSPLGFHTRALKRLLRMRSN